MVIVRDHVTVDLWYNDDISQIDDISRIDKITVFFSDIDLEYRGWIYIGGRVVGDFSTRDSAALQKVFHQIKVIE